MTDGVHIAERLEFGPVTVEVIEWRGLAGLAGPEVAELARTLREARVSARQVRLTLTDGKVQMEAGALQFQAGAIAIENKVASGLIGRWLGAKLTEESLFRPTYAGTGEIWLEPGFDHYLILGLDRETVIVGKGMFLCCDAGISVEITAESTPSAALLHEAGLFHTALGGSGFVVLRSPVPASEIVKLPVTPEAPVQVDGDAVLLRSGGVSLSIGKSAKTWLGTAFSGEGLLQTYSGRGEVWLAPLLPVYRRLRGEPAEPA